jgi:4-amino-4-deoxy-L-arabinose transferase-like glycosyltransferase
MWQQGDFLVPHSNGVPYSHKPPLLFWSIHLSWLLFGVNEVSARMVAPLFGLANLVLSARLACRLWPQEPGVSILVPFVLLALPFWTVSGTLTMFDMPLTFFVLCATLGMLWVKDRRLWQGWGLAALALGLGMLTKGPVILVYLVPLALSAPWWLNSTTPVSWPKWYAGLILALLCASALALAWALPAARAGGQVYGDAILWGQTAGRMAQSFAHRQPVWWYLPLLPLVLLPWIGQWPLWRNLKRFAADPGTRFCLIWASLSLLGLSLISGKQIHYLIPMLPPLALLAARRLAAMGAECPIGLTRLNGMLFGLMGAAMLGIRLGGARHPDIAPFAHVLIWTILVPLGIGGYFLLRPAKSFKSLTLQYALAMTLILTALQFALHTPLHQGYDITPSARLAAVAQKNGYPVAVYPQSFQQQFHFSGRLAQPLIALGDSKSILEWIHGNPSGYLLLIHRPEEPYFPKELALHHQPFRGRRIGFWKAGTLSQFLGS